MLKWALIFLVVSLIAGALGFTGVAGGAANIAQKPVGLVLVIFLIHRVLGLMAGEAIFCR